MKEKKTKVLSEIAEQIVAAYWDLSKSRQYVISSKAGYWRRGMTVNSVMFISEEPAMAIISVPKESQILACMSESMKIGLHLLPKTDSHHYARRFKSGGESGIKPEDMFLAVPHEDKHGAPILTHCEVWWSCEVELHLDSVGEHELFIVKVIDAGTGS